MPLSWKDWTKQAVSVGGTGALTLGAASSGFQAFAAGDDGKLFPYSIQDGTAWETGYGTYTNAGTSFARTSRTASSTGSALTVSTSAFLFVDLVSNIAAGMGYAMQGLIPGGRLTLTTGVPVTTSDVTGATTVYYTPYVHNVITLWDGNIWIPVTFAEVSLALGTLTAALPYDVFGFLSAGALSTELLAWTNAATRATTVTLQDGRYCKNGAKDRLYLGTFYTTSTTTTEDSGGGTTSQVGGKRFVWNMYNRVLRPASVIDTTDSWSYATGTWRQANAASGNRIECVLGLADAIKVDMFGTAFLQNNVARAAKQAIGLDSTTAFSGLNNEGWYNSNANAVEFPLAASYTGTPAAGYHALNWIEFGADGTCFFIGDNGGVQQTGLEASIWA